MAKVRTLSQRFPKGHIRQGEPTYFVEKVLNSLNGIGINMSWAHLLDINSKNVQDGKISESDLWEFWNKVTFNRHLPKNINEQKHHTIRANSKKGQKHFETGEEIQLAVWSGKPYASPQIKICPPLKVKCYDFEVFHNTMPQGIEWPLLVDGYDTDIEQVSKNDGLTVEDFKSWFKYPSPFVGQIIAWNDPIY